MNLLNVQRSKIWMRLSIIASIASIVWLALGGWPGKAHAHAELLSMTPVSGSRLDESPPAVELLFNERLDPGGARLVVLDVTKKVVADGELERFDEGKGLRLPLPKLGEGHYTVSYSVISADGHPVSGAYVFTVGDPPPLVSADRLDPHAQVGHDHHHHGDAALDTDTLILYIARIAYYAGLLGAAGLALWSLLQRKPSSVVREVRMRLLSLAGKYTLIAAIVYVAISLMDLTQDQPLSEWTRILTETTIGRLYIGILLLAFAAPLLPVLGTAGRTVWAVLFLGVESFAGHAAAFSMMGLDFIHLLAAAIWAGGLALLIAVWRKERPEAGRFALVFSKWALAAYLALWASGVGMTLAFLPSLDYLTYTPWGTWLLVKVGLTLLVLITAALIRLRLRKGDLPQGTLLKIDFSLMAAIVLVVGILTYQSPLPKNKSLHYHHMGTELHLTLRITPNLPGNNTFIYKVWLPEEDGPPKEVRLRLKPLDRDDVGPIDVPLETYQDEEFDAFDGFAKYTYRSEGPYLPFAAQWQAIMWVTEADGNLLEKETTFRIY